MERIDETERIPKQYEELVGLIGMEATLRLCNQYGGDELYIPKADGLVSSRRRDAIKAEYNGYNLKKLAAKYHLSVRMVQLILKGVRPPELKGQIKLDDLLGQGAAK